MAAQSIFEPRSANYAARVRASFARQSAMSTMGITLEDVAPGKVVLVMPFNPAFAQQHGFHHAGTTTTALDSACGYAAYSLMEDAASVMTVEFKTSLLAPAAGDQFRFIGQVIKAGRTLTFCEGVALGIRNGLETRIATMTATMMAITNHPGVKEPD